MTGHPTDPRTGRATGTAAGTATGAPGAADAVLPKSQRTSGSIESLLPGVERPARYIDHEYLAVHRAPGEAAYRVALAYPDTYEIGQSNLAIALLYDIINRLPKTAAERVYLPWVDMSTAMRAAQIALFSLESQRPVREFDLFGITIPHELAATNILELLDLAGLPLYAAERGPELPLVVGGGPSVYNPAPYAPFFDAIVIGEAEELMGELIAVHRRFKANAAATGDADKPALLGQLAAIEGVYVPALVCAPGTPGAAPVRRRVFMGFSDAVLPKQSLVPYVEVVHDRLNIEVLRGCARGCRFCQAGMTYRPVRERPADAIVAAVDAGIACTGFDEVSLTSLSSTDHAQIEQVLRRLRGLFAGQGVSVSLPSQRLDAFGIEMAALVSGEKKSGLTFAPEAGSERLRAVINKNITDADFLEAVRAAFSKGWRRCKLYMMIGLPTETDDDILAMAALVNRALAAAEEAVGPRDKGKLRITLSVGAFVPKASTPFQWCGQLPLPEIKRRIGLLRSAGLSKGISLKWHDPELSQLEAVISRAGSAAADLIEAAWRRGATFTAWSDRFAYADWLAAADDVGLDLADLAEHAYALDDRLPWENIDCGVSRRYLEAEWRRAQAGEQTADCTFRGCTDCGACSAPGIANRLAGERHV